VADQRSVPGQYAIEIELDDSYNVLGAYRVNMIGGTLTVTPASLLVTANDAHRAYGQTNPIFSATFDGFANGEGTNVLGGALVFDTSATTNSPLGTYPIEVSGLSATNYSLTYSNGTLTVQPAALTVVADNKSRVYGDANPALTGTMSGVVNGDNISASYATIAGVTSPVGAYPITSSLSDPDQKLTNYSVSATAGTLTVSPAGSTLALSSSANPTPTGSNVTLTVTVGPVPPSSAVPAGAVQFLVDGRVFGWPLPLSGGLASLSTANLTHGLHSVCAQYTSDGNFNSSTNTLSGGLLVNSAPVAGPITLSTARNQAASLSLDTVLAKCSDPEQDALSITAVNAVSAQGGTVALGAACITYTPPSNYSGPDSFTFTVQDAYAASATGTVSVTVRPPIPPLLSAITRQADGNVKLSASGEPNQAYLVQAGADLVNWSVISTNTADTNGAVFFLDLNATNYSTRFYRLAVP
jgi:hypothetical protein